MDKYSVEKAVLVQYRAGLEPIGNTDNTYVAECARKHPARLAPIGIVDWTKPDSMEQLEYWAGKQGIQGLRLDGEATSPGRERYGIWRKASQLGIIVSVYGKIDRLSEIAGLFPYLRIHVEHTGMPNVNGDQVLALARFPNISIKFTVAGLSGISKEPYPHRDTHPFFEKVYQRFGAKRIMWGSNYPPVMKDEGYERTLMFLSREIPWLCSEEKEWILGRTALSMWQFQG
jgi:predicted TIM-barrel fold metal-dependent hydrolase